ncbi:MAG: glycosyltransferase family 2 protein [Thermomicrobiales bacterium]|nr:glycosyltransferase family 2 protein [Thermomicrobiales bacterium]
MTASAAVATQPSISPETRASIGSFSLILPAHNEAENIEVVVRRAIEVLPTYFDSFEIIVVNDGSKDDTGRIVDRLAQGDPRVRAVHHPKNRGYGGALTSGFETSSGDHVMFMDADRQFDIADIELLYPFISTHKIVAGFRMMRQDELHRRIFAEIFNLVVRTLFGVHLRDIDCAFKIFDGDMIRSLELSSPGALINTEIQAKARRQGAEIQQVGVRHFPRIAGEATGGNPRVIARAMKETVVLWWRMRSYTPPPGRPNVNGPYRLGDALVVTGGLSLAALTLGALRRLKHRRT